MQNLTKGILDQYTVFDTVLMGKCIVLDQRMVQLDFGSIQSENHMVYGKVPIAILLSTMKDNNYISLNRFTLLHNYNVYHLIASELV